MKYELSILIAVLVFTSVTARPVPRPQLARRLADGIDIIGIVHWGPNTFTDKGWGYGDEDPAIVNPDAFDADQIVGACAAGGIRGLVVVAKHHDGFCLWPTKTTDHNISKSPFRNGKGDYVREMSEACRRAGLKFGIYCSPWDRNNAGYATDEYVKTYHAQVRELLDGRYGDIFEMWFDGANGGDGYYGGAREKRKIPNGYYRFDEVFRFVRELQPNVCIFNEDDSADFRFGGNERGLVDPDSRATGGHYDAIWDNYIKWANTGQTNGVSFHPVEADFPLRPEWFYHPAEKGLVKSPEYLMKLYLSSVGNAATMNIGIAPDSHGLLVDEDVAALKRFGEIREEFFRMEVASKREPFNLVVMEEDISKGEQVDGWEFLADGKVVLSGKSIGHRRIRLLPEPISPERCEIRITADGGELQGVSFRRYFVDPDLASKVSGAESKTGETAVLQNVFNMKAEAKLTANLKGIVARAAAHYRALDAVATPRMKGADGRFQLPRGYDRDKETVDMREIRDWTSGHYPGSLWYLFELTGDTFFRDRAEVWSETLAPIAKYDGNHDIGFMINCSYGNARRLLKTAAFDATLCDAAESLCHRYNEGLGLIRSWGGLDERKNFLVIPDNLMNLELLEVASAISGDRRFDRIARSHALVTMAHHFRADGGTYHVLDYDQVTKRVKGVERGQGASIETAWSRGQGWAIYGYSMMFRETGDKRFLDFAVKLADFAIGHPNMPEDGVPYWDYGAPGEERDSSAAAIMASALLELSGFDECSHPEKYRAFAVKQLLTLSSSEYFSEGDEIGHFLLKHGVGHKPGGSEVDTPLNYGDYYFLEALTRFQR